MKDIKIFFEDFWGGFDVHNNFIFSVLQKNYNVIIDEHPDYLFYSVYGYNHLKYTDCIKIFYSAENLEPDFNLCDYAIAFQHLTAQDRYFRYPIYLESGYNCLDNSCSFDPSAVLNRKFCNFVYSNSKWADPIRELFYEKLSKYKRIDSGGRYLNNIGGPVKNKIDFIKDYKFTIAFENSSLSGYTTEKLVEPMTVNSIPIYWGNPDVDKDFNTGSFVYIKNEADIDAKIQEIIELDNNDNAYIEKLTQPWVLNNSYDDWQKKLILFFDNICSQQKDKAFRRTQYGFVSTYRRKQETMGALSQGKIMKLNIFNTELKILFSRKK